MQLSYSEVQNEKKKKNEEKWREPQRPMRYHQVKQHMHMGVREEKIERERAEIIFDEIFDWKGLNLMKVITSNPKSSMLSIELKTPKQIYTS